MRYVIFVAFAILIGGAISPVKTQLSTVTVPCDQVGAVAASISVVVSWLYWINFVYLLAHSDISNL